MNQEDMLESYKRDLIRENEKKLLSNKDLINAFIKYCQSIGLVLDCENFKYIQSIGIVAQHLNILSCLMPNLKRDKEKLVECKNLFELYTKKTINPGYLYSENYMAMISPLFRRGFHVESNWAPHFVDLFWGVNDQDIDSHILLDFDRVRINVDDTCYLEKDTWYGAPFKEKISNITDGSVKLRPPSDLDQNFIFFFFNEAYALDIYWDTKYSIKSFQALEFKNSNIKIEFEGNDYYPVRYIHAEYDIEQKYFRHFDGAIQYFSESEYYERRDSDFKYYLKGLKPIKPKSVKTFKFNGKITVEMWTEFCSHFCTGNPLIHEYFSGSYSENLTNNIKNYRLKKANNN